MNVGRYTLTYPRVTINFSPIIRADWDLLAIPPYRYKNRNDSWSNLDQEHFLKDSVIVICEYATALVSCPELAFRGHATWQQRKPQRTSPSWEPRTSVRNFEIAWKIPRVLIGLLNTLIRWGLTAGVWALCQHTCGVYWIPSRRFCDGFSALCFVGACIVVTLPWAATLVCSTLSVPRGLWRQ
jgi:hypothetical protein